MRIGLLPGTFNPPTRAHLALAEAAAMHVDLVVFVLPRVLPHKEYSGVSFEDRLRLLQTVAGERFETRVTDGGLFVEIAEEFRERDADLVFLCGRDAAERIVNWDYGEPGAFLRMLEGFEMLVASRQGNFEAPANMRQRIHTLALDRDCDHISATEVRDRILSGEPWRHLVPPAIHEQVRSLYGAE